MELENLASSTVEFAVSKGADQAEISILKSTGLSVTCRNGHQENIKFSKNRSLEVVVYKNGRKGSAITTDMSNEAVTNSVIAALNLSDYTASDDCSGIPETEDLIKEQFDLELFYPRESDPIEAFDIALNLENIAMSKDDRIKISNGSSFSSSYGISVLANSNNFVISEPNSFFALNVNLIGELDGKMENNGSGHCSTDFSRLWSCEKIADEAISETVGMLGAHKFATGNYPVILRRDIAESFLFSIISALGGSAQYKHSSFLSSSLHTKVVSDWLNIDIDPLIKRSLYSSTSDNEGVKTVAHPLIHEGYVESYLLSSYSARKLGMKTNGHSGFLGNVLVRDNRKIEYGYAELLKLMDKGLIITETMGHGLNQVTGDFSYGACGFYVESGIIQYPVKGITIAGNVKDLFANRIIALGTDYDERQNINCGSILFDELKVASM